MGLLTLGINITLDGCVDHREGIADDETHEYLTRFMAIGSGPVVTWPLLSLLLVASGRDTAAHDLSGSGTALLPLRLGTDG